MMGSQGFSLSKNCMVAGSVLKFENVDGNSQCVMFIPLNQKFNSPDKRIATVLTITVLNLSELS
jgi:hypothetical protein